MVLLEQPIRGSAAYEKDDQIRRPAALLDKEFADAAKYRAQAGKVEAQAEQDKAQAEENKVQAGQSSQDNIEIGVKKELAKDIEDIKCDSTVQVCKITSSLRGRLLQGRGSCKSTIQSAKAKCSRLANTTEESQFDGRIVRLNNSGGCTQAFSSSANMPVNVSCGNTVVSNSAISTAPV
jgi:hypothetical protein